jgi:hypothetical protein
VVDETRRNEKPQRVRGTRRGYGQNAVD